MGLLLQTAIIMLSLAGGIWCHPKLADLRYPIFYLSPRLGPRANMVEKLAIIPNPREDSDDPPIITNRLTIATDPETSDEEVTQFHSQDALGRFVFGFHVPNQVRMESRDHDGTVRGSYSYVDPYGNIVKMQYWDDGNGFHTAGNNLPRNTFQQPQYTPEVQAARDEHFKLYQQALAAASALDDSDNKDEDRIVESDTDMDTVQLPQVEHDDRDDDSVVIGEDDPVEDDLDTSDFNHFPKFPFEQEILTPNHVVDDERDSISIDNPELSFRNVPGDNFWFRKRKSFDFDRPVNDAAKDQLKQVEEELADKVGSYDSADADKVQMDERILQPSISFLATKTGSIPVAAVHDVQVSPFQRGNVENHQLLPVFNGPLIPE